MTTDNAESPLRRAAAFVRRRKLFFIPLAIGILLWMGLVLLTDGKNIAPFVYSTY